MKLASIAGLSTRFIRGIDKPTMRARPIRPY